MQRQPDYVGVGATNPGDEHSCSALDRITSSLALPLATGEIVGDLALFQAFKTDVGGDEALAHFAGWVDEGDAAIDAVAAPAQQIEAAAGFSLGLGLWQDAAADADDGIGGEGVFACASHSLTLGQRQTCGKFPRFLVFQWGLVHVSGADSGRIDPDLGQQINPPRRGAGEDQGQCRYVCQTGNFSRMRSRR
jgi:hypothetical protein